MRPAAITGIVNVLCPDLVTVVGVLHPVGDDPTDLVPCAQLVSVN